MKYLLTFILYLGLLFQNLEPNDSIQVHWLKEILIPAHRTPVELGGVHVQRHLEGLL